MSNEKVKHGDSAIDVVVKISEGNPGALRVCTELIKSGPEGMMLALDADDMNLRGPNLWLAFKDHCKESLEALIKGLKTRDADMVATVNANNGCDGYDPSALRAVTSGGSF